VDCIQGANFQYDLSLEFLRGWSLKKKMYVWFFFSYHIYCVIFSYIILTFLQTSRCFLSNGTNYMHILASGPEQQAVYFGHVIQTGSGERRGLIPKELYSKNNQE
jgi:hypothetical protein